MITTVKGISNTLLSVNDAKHVNIPKTPWQSIIVWYCHIYNIPDIHHGRDSKKTIHRAAGNHVKWWRNCKYGKPWLNKYRKLPTKHLWECLFLDISGLYMFEGNDTNSDDYYGRPIHRYIRNWRDLFHIRMANKVTNKFFDRTSYHISRIAYKSWFYQTPNPVMLSIIIITGWSYTLLPSVSIWNWK